MVKYSVKTQNVYSLFSVKEYATFYHVSIAMRIGP